MTGNVHPDDIKLILETLLTADLSIGFGSNRFFELKK